MRYRALFMLLLPFKKGQVVKVEEKIIWFLIPSLAP